MIVSAMAYNCTLLFPLQTMADGSYDQQGANGNYMGACDRCETDVISVHVLYF